MKKLILILGIMFLVSCTTQKSATNYFKKNDVQLAELCNERFPVPETERELIPGDTIVKEKIITLPGVDIPCPEPTAENPKPVVKCPPCQNKVTERTIRDTLKIKVRDTRELFIYQTELKKVNEKNSELQLQNETLKDDLRTAKNQRNNFMWILVCFGVGLALFVIFKIFK